MTKISEQSTTGPDLLSTEEAARKVGVSIKTYRSYAKLAGVKPSRLAIGFASLDADVATG